MNDIDYRLDGPVTGQSPDWTFQPSDGSGYNPAEGYYPDKGGRLLGPRVPARPNSFYRLRFDLRARERVYWGVNTFNADASPRIADNYGAHFGYGWQTLTRLTCTEDAVHALQPFFQSPNGLEVRNLEIRRVDAPEAAALFDELHDNLPPLRWTPPDLSRDLPRTFAALLDGTPWKVVLLGDSIVNDTFNSCFPAPLRRIHPRMDWRLICSVRGATGCWFYREPEAFSSFVSDYRPDLLVIGGCSHRDDLEALKIVAERARSELGCEILLLSGPMLFDWRAYNEKDGYIGAAAQTPPPPRPYYPALEAYARENGFAYGDMERAWAEYLAASRTPHLYLYRDGIHANEFGKIVLGRMFVELMTPRSKLETGPNVL